MNVIIKAGPKEIAAFLLEIEKQLWEKNSGLYEIRCPNCGNKHKFYINKYDLSPDGQIPKDLIESNIYLAHKVIE